MNMNLTGMANMPPLIMKPAIPVPPIPTFPRTRKGHPRRVPAATQRPRRDKRGKGQTNRCASFTLSGDISAITPLMLGGKQCLIDQFDKLCLGGFPIGQTMDATDADGHNAV